MRFGEDGTIVSGTSMRHERQSIAQEIDEAVEGCTQIPHCSSFSAVRFNSFLTRHVRFGRNEAIQKLHRGKTVKPKGINFVELDYTHGVLASWRGKTFNSCCLGRYLSGYALLCP